MQNRTQKITEVTQHNSESGSDREDFTKKVISGLGFERWFRIGQMNAVGTMWYISRAAIYMDINQRWGVAEVMILERKEGATSDCMPCFH